MPALILPAPLLAADLNSVFTAILVVVWIVGTIWRFIGKQNPPGPPVANRPRLPARPAEAKLQKEIDIFIQQIGGKKGSGRPAAPEARPAAPKPAPQPAVGDRRPPRAPVEAKPTARAKPPRRERPGSEIAARQAPGSASLGSAVQKQLKQFGDKVSQEVAPHLDHKVEQRVEQQLGKIGQAAEATKPVSDVDRRGMELLRNPASLRQAMIVNIILSRPPALQPRRMH